MHDLFGYTPEEWTWTPGFWRSGIHPDDLAHVVEMDDRSNETKDAYSLDYRFRHADGHWVWVHDEATFVPDPDDEGFWQGFLVDITERKQAEDQLSGRRGQVPNHRRAEPGHLLHAGDRPDDPAISLTTYIAPGNTDLIGYTPRGDPGRPGTVALDHPS